MSDTIYNTIRGMGAFAMFAVVLLVVVGLFLGMAWVLQWALALCGLTVPFIACLVLVIFTRIVTS